MATGVGGYYKTPVRSGGPMREVGGEGVRRGASEGGNSGQGQAAQGWGAKLMRTDK